MRGTNLNTDTAKGMSDAEMEDVILHGGKRRLASHAYASRGVSAADAKALVAHIRGLQK
jgi:hypothetical protein